MLRMTRASDYSLRTLMHLGSHQARTTSNALSRHLGVPLNHLEKVVQTLSRGGYVKTSLGRGGGIQLARPPEEITLKEIIELVDGPTAIAVCFRDGNHCPIKNCLLSRKIEEAQEKMLAVFAGATIRDLINEG
ncbi:MAG: Rrf2 family transcriptional regulator [Chloroflexi bacterium]|nr:Rrf2 family transcriptional regulator [Chloroflexota bacterium]